jgi:hypothetical protein
MAVPTEAITRERLDRWAARMRDSHATPLILIGVGHDENIGQIVVCTLDEPEITRNVLRQLLQEALDQLE